MWRTFLHWRNRRLAIRQLMELDARLLKDIGIERGQIETAIDGLAGAGDTVRGSAPNSNGASIRSGRPNAVPAQTCEA
ncbi:MAG: DUF1127 domain-containing protein [Alphaproteobacteria bacterium]|nr:DUF1127 domain-containing protein [Alphaproteobacteria bacterium]